MAISFEGIGAYAATFYAADAKEGQVVKIGGDATVATCAAGEDFCGVALQCREGVCAVQLGGLTTVSYSGTAPTAGFAAVAADGKGGIAAKAGGRVHMIVSVDKDASTCVIAL